MKQEIALKTVDNVKIAADYYNKGKDEIVIIAPGWFMTKDSWVFREISKAFLKKYDVIAFDFRGHGRSGGFYTFSAKEEYDLESVVNFATQKKYKKIYLVGFSLGAAICIIYASKNNADKLILISPPCNFSKIENQMYKKEAWFETCKKFELKRFFTVRPSFIVHKKTKPLDVVGNINSKILFMGGKKDPTVHFWHCIELFKKTKCAKKLVLYENGIHAEDLFLHDKTGFMQTCFDWLDEKKDT